MKKHRFTLKNLNFSEDFGEIYKYYIRHQLITSLCFVLTTGPIKYGNNWPCDMKSYCFIELATTSSEMIKRILFGKVKYLD